MPLMEAHTQWRDRPDDQRFQTLTDLKAAVAGRRNRARTQAALLATLQFSVPPTGSDLTIAIGGEAAIPTHWSFGQLSSQLHAPASYLRTLPPDLTVQCLEYGVKKAFSAKQATLLLDTEDNGERTTLRATTSESYGRIWDLEVVKMVESIVHYTDGRFFNPKDWGGTPSGLYASDRDVFVFLIDGGSLVDGGGERDQLHRGFFVWNSEVGSATFGLMTFLFRAVCGNHLVWGAEDVKALKIRHNGLAPERFVEQAQPALLSYVNASAKPLEAQIRLAKQTLLPAARDARMGWLLEAGFTKAEAQGGLAKAEQEEGDSRTLWQVVNGLTAYARTYAHLDTRVALEKRAGKLLPYA